jgi:hypothetical protein
MLHFARPSRAGESAIRTKLRRQRRKVSKKEIRDAIGEQGVVRWTLEQGDAAVCLKGKKLVKRHFVFCLNGTG